MTYRICTWDHEGDGWELCATVDNIWKLRPIIRELRQLWSDCSLLVVDEDNEPHWSKER